MRRILKCDSVCTICDKAQYNEASLYDKMCLIMHLIFCKTCRDYVRNNRKLTKQVRSEVGKLNLKEKAKLKRQIDSELNKTSSV